MNETWVTITGYVGSVVVRDLPAGGVLATLRVATTPRRLVEGHWSDGTTSWHTVKVWRQLADHVVASVHKGDPVVVLGRLVAEEWTRTDGTEASENVVVAHSLGHDLRNGTATFERRPTTGHGVGASEEGSLDQHPADSLAGSASGSMAGPDGSGAERSPLDAA